MKANFIIDDKIGGILFLLCAAAMQVIVFWYPFYLCTYYSAPDDGYGFVLIFALPFWFIAGGIAANAFYRLFKAVGCWQRRMVKYLYIVSGTFLLLISICPALIALWFIFTL